MEAPLPSHKAAKILCGNPCNAVVFLAILASLLVCGCAVGPDFLQPEPAMPDTWHQQLTADMGTGESVQQTWWRQFNDPVLNKLIERAEAGNLDLTIALERIKCLANALSASNLAALALGPNAFIPAASKASTTPAARGSSGPTIARATSFSLAKASIFSVSLIPIGTF